MDMIRIERAPGGAGEDGALAPLDWTGLRARFLAARELRAALAPVGGAPAASFDAAAAAAIASLCGPAGQVSPGVNPTGLGNGKVEAAMECVVAEARTAGERG